METLVTIIVSTCVIVGAFFVLTVAVAFFKERDAISRINALGPATALGLPLISLGVGIQWGYEQGFSVALVLKTLLTIFALILVSSVASNVMARSAYLSGAPVDERTSPNDLAD